MKPRSRLLIALGLSVAVPATWWLWPAGPPPSPAAPFIFTDGFENAARLEELFPKDAGRWHGMQCESGTKPTKNVVELSTEHVHSGRQALKLVAGPYDGHTASKSDIQRELLRFVKGDHVWSSAWYFLAGDGDAGLVFLWDLETTQYGKSPGRRLYLQEGEWLASDLGKWWTGKTFRQPWSKEVKFPKDQWVRLKVHLVLSEKRDGVMEVWQDGVKVLDARGQTLPTAATIYSRFQVGITANGNSKSTCTLFIDDITISNRPLPEDKEPAPKE